MARIKANTLKMVGIAALFCVSLACFTYINTIDIQGAGTWPEKSYVEELAPENPDVLPDVQLIKHIVRKALEFMSKSTS